MKFDWFFSTGRTVDDIISKWTKAIQDLEAHAETKLAESIRHNTLVREYETLVDLADAEYEKAKIVAAKIKAIFN
jgi:hypothetical protein